jgi:hypothetical protein
MTIVHPIYYRIIQREGTRWRVKGSPLCSQAAIGLRDIADYGMTVEELLISLFRIECGLSGYYLADLRHKKYYYCGLQKKDVKATFRRLGIGRDDPMG